MRIISDLALKKNFIFYFKRFNLVNKKTKYVQNHYTLSLTPDQIAFQTHPMLIKFFH